MNEKIKIILEGPCTACGTETSSTNSIELGQLINTLELKELMLRKFEKVLKEAKIMQCDECFLKNKFGLSPELVQEVVSSTSSEVE